MTDTSPRPCRRNGRRFDRLTHAGIAEDQDRRCSTNCAILRQSVATKADLNIAIQTLKHDLTVRGGLMSAAVVAVLASLKFFG